MLLPRHSIISQPSAPVATAIRYSPAAADAGDDVFACATPSGFFVQRIQPYGEAYRREFGAPGVRLAVPVADTSLVLLVGKGRSALLPSTAVTLWDDQLTLDPQDPLEGFKSKSPSYLSESAASSSTASDLHVMSRSNSEDAEVHTDISPNPPVDPVSSLRTSSGTNVGLHVDRHSTTQSDWCASSSSSNSTGSLVSATSISTSRYQLKRDDAALPERIEGPSNEIPIPTSVRHLELHHADEESTNSSAQDAQPFEAMSDVKRSDSVTGNTQASSLDLSLVSANVSTTSSPEGDEQVVDSPKRADAGDIPDFDEDTVGEDSHSLASQQNFRSSPQEMVSPHSSPVPIYAQPNPQAVDIPLKSPRITTPPQQSPVAHSTLSPMPEATNCEPQVAEHRHQPKPRDVSHSQSAHEALTAALPSHEFTAKRTMTPQQSPFLSRPITPKPQPPSDGATCLIHGTQSSEHPVLQEQESVSPSASICPEALTSSRISSTSHATISANDRFDPAPTSDLDGGSILIERVEDLQLSPGQAPSLSAHLGNTGALVPAVANDDMGSEPASDSDPGMFMSVLDPPATGSSALLVPDVSAGGQPLSRTSSRASFTSLSPPGTPAEALTLLPSAHASASTLQGVTNLSDNAPNSAQAALMPSASDSPAAPLLGSPLISPKLEEPESDGSSIGAGRCAPENMSSQPAPPVLRSVVAQFEFGETVRNVYTHTFNFRPSRSHHSRRSPASQALRARPAQSYIAVVVVLKTRAIILELGPFPHPRDNGSGSESAALPPWKAQERLVTPIYPSRQGLGAISSVDGHPGQAIVALPGRQAGLVQLIALPIGPEHVAHGAYGPTAIIAAHESALAAISLSACGTLLATMSDKGTLVRVWSTVHPADKQKQKDRLRIELSKVRELRRGLDTAKIHDVCFSPDARWLAAVSETGTIHFFSLLIRQGTSTPPPRAAGTAMATKGKSKLSSLSRVVPPSMLPRYFQSEWSTGLFRLRLATFASVSESKTSLQHSGVGDLSMQTGYGDVSHAPPADWVKVASKGKEPTAAGPTREGQWATLRQRISSARKGEVAIDERVVLGWTAARPSEAEPYHLLAATSAGHFYRIALDPPSIERAAKSDPSSHTFDTHDGEDEDLVLSMYRSSTSTTATSATSVPSSAPTSSRTDAKAKAPTATVSHDADDDAMSGSKKCHLEEFRSFGRSDVFGP